MNRRQFLSSLPPTLALATGLSAGMVSRVGVNRRVSTTVVPPAPPASNNLIVTQTLGSTGVFSINVGCYLENVSGVTQYLTSLGLYKISGSSQMHEHYVYDESGTGTPVASAFIDFNGAPNGFNYTSITPYAVLSGSRIYCCGTYFSGGDPYYQGSDTTITTPAQWSCLDAALAFPGSAPAAAGQGAGHCFGTVDFVFST